MAGAQEQGWYLKQPAARRGLAIIISLQCAGPSGFLWNCEGPSGPLVNLVVSAWYPGAGLISLAAGRI